MAFGLSGLYCLGWIGLGVLTVRHLGAELPGLTSVFWRAGQHHITLALVGAVSLPVLLVLLLLCTARAPRAVWAYVVVFACSVLLIPYLLGRWPHLVPDLLWGALAGRVVRGLAGAWALMDRAVRT